MMSTREFIDKVKEELESFIEEFRENLEKKFEEYVEKVEELSSRTMDTIKKRDYKAFRELIEDIRVLREELHTSLRSLVFRNRMKFRKLCWKLRKEAYSFINSIKGEERSEVLDEIRSIFEDSRDRIENIIEDYRERMRDLSDALRDLSHFRVSTVGPRSIMVMKADILNEVGRFLDIGMKRVEDIMERLQKALKSAFETTPEKREESTVVSSIRLSKNDLEIIDCLVEVGIFRSRSEGVAFFTHKGIEASREVFERLREKLNEIQRLHSEVKKELESIFKREEKREKQS
ncbi:MAG: hypothetical protein DRJ49_04915 [Thermoprotei archaeon]|nr:MAG: hypothetical protein DRJ49_04915 [Thermoprotei archaeon]